MPSKKVTTPILGGHYYHLFNRGINHQTTFFTAENYQYFLNQLDCFLSGYVLFLSYCLLPNHFHLIVKVNDEISHDGTIIKSEEEVGKIVVNQIRRFFISYSMAINKQENRTGNSFETKYKRLEIEDEEYLKYAIFYTHFKPEKHRIETDFKNYKYSSFRSFISEKPTKIAKDLVFEIFGSKEEFIEYHSYLKEEKESVILE